MRYKLVTILNTGEEKDAEWSRENESLASYLERRLTEGGVMQLLRFKLKRTKYAEELLHNLKRLLEVSNKQ